MLTGVRVNSSASVGTAYSGHCLDLCLTSRAMRPRIETCEAHGRAKVSAHAYALHERIFEAERVAELDGRVYEVHPEVCFCEMAGEPLQHSKRTLSGITERLELLKRNGITIPSAPGRRRRSYSRRCA